MFQSDPQFRIVQKFIRLCNITVDFPTIAGIVLPALTQDTINFCVGEFELKEVVCKLPNYFIYNINLEDDLFVNRPDDDTFDPDLVKKLIQNNADGIVEYLKHNDLRYATGKGTPFHSYAYIALDAGHVELFLNIFAITRPSNHYREFHKYICVYLLSANRTDFYKKYSELTHFDAYCRTIEKTITISDIDDVSTLSPQTIEFLENLALSNKNWKIY